MIRAVIETLTTKLLRDRSALVLTFVLPIVFFSVFAGVYGKRIEKDVAFYAAGIGVMFLLIHATASGGSLLEEAEAGTLDRLLATRMTLRQLLTGKLLFLTIVATAQLTIMFLWGAIFFGLNLRDHVPGFIVMTIVTAFASSAFGLLLSSIVRTRAQLGATSNLVALTMSAIGGSFYPRPLMPPFIQKIGLLTINAWALDGFLKVFWKNLPVATLWPQVLVLAVFTAIIFALALRFARRWERA
jgi:ABC-2 type transport system permease protein